MKRYLYPLVFIVFFFLMLSPVLAEHKKGSNKHKRPKHKKALSEMDANGDKEISKEECVAYFEKMARQKADKLFSKVDLNSDGVLSEEEVKKAHSTKGLKEERAAE